MNQLIQKYHVHFEGKSLDLNDQGMMIEGNDISGYHVSFFNVRGHECDWETEAVSEYPVAIKEGVECKRKYIDKDETGLCYLECNEKQLVRLIKRLKELGATDGVPADL